jgi:hypothetical protein
VIWKYTHLVVWSEQCPVVIYPHWLVMMSFVTQYGFVGFEVLVAVAIKSSFVWGVSESQWILADHSVLQETQRVLNRCLLYYSCLLYTCNPKSGQANCSACLLPLGWFLALLIFLPWRCRRHFPSKCRLAFDGLHGVIFEKIDLVSIFWHCRSLKRLQISNNYSSIWTRC